MTAQPDEPLVRLRDVRVVLGGKTILDGVDADLARGKTTALVGLNGAGKSTLLRVLLREIPYSGEVRFFCGHDHSQPDPSQIGYVPQKLRVEANLPLTVLDLFGLSLKRKPLFSGVGRLRPKVEALLAGVNAERLIASPLAALSGGELQRVLLALALEPHPELLLLDEPVAGIDFKDLTPFYDLIARLQAERGLTILLVSHDLSVVSRIASEVLCLNFGRVACKGPPGEVLTSEVLAQTFGPMHRPYGHSHGG